MRNWFNFFINGKRFSSLFLSMHTPYRNMFIILVDCESVKPPFPQNETERTF